jgi:DNA-directed RNA polymerase subunit RPC12/RpoP
MSASQPASSFFCTQCGGELHPDEGQIFVNCPYCESTVFLDKSQVVFHWYLASTLDHEKARGSLARWMAGNQTVKDLDKKSQINDQDFRYFPIWFFKSRSIDGQDEIRQFPAAATSVTEMGQVKIPAGDMRKFDDSLESQSQPPTVPLETALDWLKDRDVSKDQILELALVHVPMYFFKYTYQGDLFTAVVEGATGEVFANIFPAKPESPYRLIGALSALVFLCLATFPVIGALFNNLDGFGIGLITCMTLGIIAAPILFFLAIWVAAKK